MWISRQGCEQGVCSLALLWALDSFTSRTSATQPTRSLHNPFQVKIPMRGSFVTLTLSDTSVRTNIQEGWCTALLASRKGVLAWVEPDPVLKNSKGNRSWQKAKDNSPHSDIADSLRQSGRPCHYAVPQALCSGGADPGN